MGELTDVVDDDWARRFGEPAVHRHLENGDDHPCDPEVLCSKGRRLGEKEVDKGRYYHRAEGFDRIESQR